MDASNSKFINHCLGLVEEEFGVKVIHKALMGSRRYGFAGPNSDYDIHFVYLYPENRYLSLENPPTQTIVMKLNGFTEIHGYEFRHYLSLIRKQNPNAMDLISTEDWEPTWSGFRAEMALRAQRFFNPVPVWNHRRATGFEFMKKMRGPSPDAKSFLYVAFGVLSCLWITKFPQRQYPPLNLDHLIMDSDMADEALGHISLVAAMRRVGKDMAVRIDTTDMLERELKEMEPPVVFDPKASSDPSSLNSLFMDVVRGSCNIGQRDNDFRLFTTSPLEMVKFRMGQRDDPRPRDQK